VKLQNNQIYLFVLRKSGIRQWRRRRRGASRGTDDAPGRDTCWNTSV